MSPTATALAGYAAWFVALTVALGFYRTYLVQIGKKQPNAFSPDGSDVDAFGRRLTRARDNCYETLPVFVALALAASMAGRIALTDGTAMWVLWARIGQSVTHLASTSVPAIFVRFGFFIVQIVIYAYWAIQLLTG